MHLHALTSCRSYASRKVNGILLGTRSLATHQFTTAVQRYCSHMAHLHWQKPKSKKPGFFVVPFTLPETPITFGVFGTKSACAKRPESHTDVLVSGAHARLLSTFDRTRVVRITSLAAVG